MPGASARGQNVEMGVDDLDRDDPDVAGIALNALFILPASTHRLLFPAHSVFQLC